MTNKEIARSFSRLGKIMELHDENPFKIRSYSNAYITIRKIEKPLTETTPEEMAEYKGIGKAIVEKIQELIETGTLQAYKRYVNMTPAGIIEMLDIKGFGPKKIKTIWNQLEIVSIGELLYACNENRLVELKGFGYKTQEALRQQLEYFVSSKGKYHYGSLADEAHDLQTELLEAFPMAESSLCGAIRRLMPEVEAIELMTTANTDDIIAKVEELTVEDGVMMYKGYPCHIYQVEEEKYGKLLFEQSASEEFLEAVGEVDPAYSENEIFENLGLAYVPAEYRESGIAYEQARVDQLPELITNEDLRGVIHNHSTYSDGLHSLEQMADYTYSQGYEYLVMSDHSKAAFYANGLKEDRCIQQMEEIDELNKKYDNFKIYKSIECDILNDGSLDYDDDFLREFDLIIASVHSNLRMDEAKANARLVKAIEHPSTHILGHPTGRLLLSREGYPIDHQLIIDACVANNVVIELNANPLRLDLDWTWIPYLLERGGMISINPDAHHKEQIHYMKYGVAVARKAGLTVDGCLNTMDLDQFDSWVSGLPS